MRVGEKLEVALGRHRGGTDAFGTGRQAAAAVLVRVFVCTLPRVRKRVEVGSPAARRGAALPRVRGTLLKLLLLKTLPLGLLLPCELGPRVGVMERRLLVPSAAAADTAASVLLLLLLLVAAAAAAHVGD